MSLAPTPQGVAGAAKAEAVFPRDGHRLEVKWKRAPRLRCDSWNNNPRKELACYAVQRWFLDPVDYVVPTIAVRGVALDAYRRLEPKTKPTIRGVDCVIGALAVWMQHVHVPDVLFDPQRFADDAAYARHFADFNVFAYLVAHRDGRAGNILAAEPHDGRVFAVDNGISFDPWIWNFLCTNWNRIRVPAIRRVVVERLRAIDRRALAKLAVLAELALARDGIFHPVRAGRLLDDGCGARVRRDRVQLGLTAKEIDALGKRLAKLLADVDRGAIATF